jgi:hypothetical protein
VRRGHLVAGIPQHPREHHRSVRSSSQSIRISAKVRVLGLPQDEPNRVGAVEKLPRPRHVQPKAVRLIRTWSWCSEALRATRL